MSIMAQPIPVTGYPLLSFGHGGGCVAQVKSRGDDSDTNITDLNSQPTLPSANTGQ